MLKRLRELKLLIGLDTNGTNPAMLREIIAEGLVDRIAMDYKAPREKYDTVTRRRDSVCGVGESLRLLGESHIDYEVRITLHPALHSQEDISAMADELTQYGIRHVVLQRFKPWKVLDKRLYELPGYSSEELKGFVRIFTQHATVR